MKLIKGLPEKEYYRQIYIKNREKKLRQSKAYRESHRSEYLLYLKNYSNEHRDEKRAKDRKWKKDNQILAMKKRKEDYQKNRKRYLEQSKEWQKKNPEKCRARNMKRLASKILRTPKWADIKAIEEFYINCPFGYEVDHIIPLQGKHVSGFHVLDNLQYLTKSQNCSKGNSFPLLKE